MLVSLQYVFNYKLNFHIFPLFIDTVPNRTKSLEEFARGNCFRRTKYLLNFKLANSSVVVCQKNLKEYHIKKKLKDNIENNVSYVLKYNNIVLTVSVDHKEDANLSIDLSIPNTHRDKYLRYYHYMDVNSSTIHIENQVLDINFVSLKEFAVELPMKLKPL